MFSSGWLGNDFQKGNYIEYTSWLTKISGSYQSNETQAIDGKN